MNEKLLIKSERYNVDKLIRVLIMIGICLTVLIFLICFISDIAYYNDHMKLYTGNVDLSDIPREVIKEFKREHASDCYRSCPLRFNNAFSYALSEIFVSILISLIPTVVMMIFSIIIDRWLRSYELIITDKRIYGKVAFGKQVDLPLDSVSATSTIGLFKGVAVSTASGKISFLAIKNVSEIYKVISNLLIERQQNKNVSSAASTPSSAPAGADTADQLMKYKELLDSGVITQEEFDAKKKQLLGL